MKLVKFFSFALNVNMDMATGGKNALHSYPQMQKVDKGCFCGRDICGLAHMLKIVGTPIISISACYYSELCRAITSYLGVLFLLTEVQ